MWVSGGGPRTVKRWQTRSRSAIRFDQLGHLGMGAAQQKKNHDNLSNLICLKHETPMTDVVRAYESCNALHCTVLWGVLELKFEVSV